MRAPGGPTIVGSGGRLPDDMILRSILVDYRGNVFENFLLHVQQQFMHEAFMAAPTRLLLPAARIALLGVVLYFLVRTRCPLALAARRLLSRPALTRRWLARCFTARAPPLDAGHGVVAAHAVHARRVRRPRGPDAMRARHAPAGAPAANGAPLGHPSASAPPSTTADTSPLTHWLLRRLSQTPEDCYAPCAPGR
jgi:hypothetical protein